MLNMDLDNNFTALIIAICVVCLLAGLAIYYNVPQFNNVQSNLNLQAPSESIDNNTRIK